MNEKLLITKEALEKKGFAVQCFATKEEAAAYLNEQVNDTTVGFGGSITLDQMGLYESLDTHNAVYWHWRQKEGMTGAEIMKNACSADTYFTSVNGLSQNGEIVNIDATCNRVASMVYGHRKVYFVAGVNKVAPTLEEAMWRARNIASPLNARRLNKKTPCAVNADRCYDCKSSDRICRDFSILCMPPVGADSEVILIDEELGY